MRMSDVHALFIILDEFPVSCCRLYISLAIISPSICFFPLSFKLIVYFLIYFTFMIQFAIVNSCLVLFDSFWSEDTSPATANRTAAKTDYP